MAPTSRYVLVFVLALLSQKCETKRSAFMTLSNDEYHLHEVQDDEDVPNYHLAKATFDNNINTTGWAFLEVHTNGDGNDEEQAYAAGYIEGSLTSELMWMHWVNTMKDICEGKMTECVEIALSLRKNKKWVSSMIESLGNTDPYWYQVKLYWKQLEGLADGYNKAVGGGHRALSLDYMMAFNLQGDLEDLFAMKELTGPLGSGRCSALIKILPGGSDLYTSQITWTSYSTMLRIQKKYVLKFRTLPKSKDVIKGHTMSFSSSPGQLQSGDDFYIISSGLVTLETTIGNSNKELWKYVKPVGQVMEFVRSMVANRMAATGEDWTKIFSKYNSGTYNNQWMIVDYHRFKPGSVLKNPKAGLLWVLEQLPGTIESQDMTDHLVSTTYWSSYNLPYFPKIFNLSGTGEMVKKYGDWFTYDKNPRAQIFKRDHSNVKNMNDMYYLMRYNDFKHDPLSKCDCNPPYSAENSIAARNDLNLINGTYPFHALSHRSHGATDAKITNIQLMKTYEFLSVSGPIHNETRGIPPFQWSKSDFDKTVSHVGQPDLWMFKPITHKWEWNQN